MTQEEKIIKELHAGIRGEREDVDLLLWQAVLAFQDYPLRTSSGLPFSYRIKRKKNGEYSGEILVSRKEDSKTLTKSSVLLAFHTVLEKIREKEASRQEMKEDMKLAVPEYSGPKAIGQIFGISYIYSLFWKLGLIEVPEKVADKLGQKEGHKYSGHFI